MTDVRCQWMCDFFWKHYPERCEAKHITKGTGQEFPEGGLYKIDNSKSKKDLGLEYRDFNTMMTDTCKRFEELEAQLNK